MKRPITILSFNSRKEYVAGLLCGKGVGLVIRWSRVSDAPLLLLAVVSRQPRVVLEIPRPCLLITNWLTSYQLDFLAFFS